MTDVLDATALARRTARERLGNFAEALRELGGSHSARTGDHPRLRFALQDLLPSRLHAALLYVEPREAGDVEDLSSFLEALETTAAAEAAQAVDGEQLSEAFTLALDDLHSYLLAHAIVDRRYRLFQGIGWPTRTPARARSESFRVDAGPPGPFRVPGHIPLAAELEADAHEYSLAA